MENQTGRVTLAEYPRWTGDFTLPRLRAKLANKHLLHPDVEPDYLEVYRTDLRQTALIRNSDTPQDLLGATWASGLTWHVTRDPAAMTVPAWRSALSEPRYMGHSGSVPSLGVRRTERTPASMAALPPDRSQSHQALPRMPSRPQLGPGVAISPSGIPISPSAEERKEIDRLRSILGASKRLWAAAHGVEPQIGRFLEDTREEEPQIKNASLLSRLSKESFPAIKLTLKAGADINWQNPEWDGATLLVKSARTGARAIVMYMLAIGADHTIVDDSGRSVLHWAALEGFADLVEYFLENLPDDFGAQSINQPDSGGDRPLHLAAYSGHLPVVLLLVRAGADLSLTNAGGHAPADLARAARMWEVVSYLVENEQGEGDRYPLQHGHVEGDKAGREPLQVRDLLRPYGMAKAEQVREAVKDMKLKNTPDLSLLFEPKPKVKKEEKKKDDKAKGKKK